MCELFGLSAAKKTDISGSLRTFFGHGTANPHGWGLAFYDWDELIVKKEPVSSVNSPFLKKRLRGSFEADLLLAHIRLATKGAIEYRNTHPFTGKDAEGREWALIHNGTIFESEELAPFMYRQEGNTDSERILCDLLNLVNEQTVRLGRGLTDPELFRLVDDLLARIAPENKVNILLSDGRYLYAHSNYREGLHFTKTDGAVLISTKALESEGQREADPFAQVGVPEIRTDADFDAAVWEELPINTLHIFREGELVFKGRTHEYEFIDSEEKMRYLYLDFAGM